MRVSALFLAAAAICCVSAFTSPQERSSLDPSSQPVGTISTGRQSRKTKRHTSTTTTTRSRRQNRRDILRERSAQALVQRAQDVNSLMDQLTTLHDGLLASQQSLHNSRQRMAKDKSLQKGKSSGPFKSEVSNELRRYRSQYKQTTPVINELSAALSDFGREKGLAYYNKDSQLQTILKEIIDSIKYTLNDVNYIAFKIPALGGTLGPLVYDVKCLVDVLLNGSENTVDHILNNYAGDLKDLDSLLGLSLASMPGLSGLGLPL